MLKLLLILLFLLPAAGLRAQPAPADTAAFADFVEPGFPFITTTVDARGLAPALPTSNIAVRAVVVQLGDSTYYAFDPDLLRAAVAWRGDFLPMTTMAQVSYQEAGNKGNQIPYVLGRPLFGTGVYPGWRPGTPDFVDPRPEASIPEEVGRGPLPPSVGRWNGLYVVGDRVVLTYEVGGTEIYEQPSRVAAEGEVGVARTFRVGPGGEALSLIAAERGRPAPYRVQEDRALLYHGEGQDTVTAVGLAGAPAGTRLRVAEGRYVTVHLPPRTEPAAFRVVTWKGPSARLDAFERMLAAPVEEIDFRQGGPAHWPERVTTRGTVAPDTAALVVDRIARPLPNPWRRNVRIADVDFFEDGRAAVVTFEGDVWLVSGFDDDLQDLAWKRFASGLYEPMSISVRDGQVYVFGREGIVRLHDLNDDDEADFYENFSNLAVQSAESREFPLSMVEKPGGGFYLGKGAALDMGPQTSPATMPGFRAGGRHSGTVLEVASDGRSVRVVATGLREPYLGIHPRTELLTASDQQGNFVPTTPIYVIREGGYYGVPATAHRDPLPAEVVPPVTWIPHEVDPSGAEQVWITGGRMGPLNGSLVHLSYGRPTAYRILLDSLGQATQGGVVTLPVRFPGPVMKGQVHPQSGRLYLVGFQVWGSQAEAVSGFYRLRATDEPLILPTDVQAGEEGLILRFDAPLDPAAAEDLGRYGVRRWNYHRTERYGSGHFTLAGEAGQEVLPVADVQLSRDGRAVLLVIPDMREVMQMAVDYRLAGVGGTPAENTVHLTVNRLAPLDLAAKGFEPVRMAEVPLPAPQQAVAEAPAERPTAEMGGHLFLELGCVACHSTDGTTAGKLGPTLQGLHGSLRRFADGTTARADAEYLRQSILDPSSRIVEGFAEGMPIYSGVLSDAQVESLVLFIQSLSE